jgi:DNA polymerase III delta subunit
MLTLIHGDDITKSRQLFISLKEKYPDTVSLDGQDVTLTDLAQVLEGGDLFSDTKKLFIEQLITKKRASVEYKSIINYLLAHADKATIVIWEGKELENNLLSTFKSNTIRLFKLPQSLFALLDTIKPGYGKQLLHLFHQTLATTEEEVILYMLIRHFRLLLALHNISTNYSSSEHSEARSQNDNNSLPTDPPTGGGGDRTIIKQQIEEVKRMQGWQKTKLERQSNLFSESQLITYHNKLFEIDLEHKTGKLSGSLSSAIDIFLLDV